MMMFLCILFFGLGSLLFAMSFSYLSDVQKAFPKHFNQPFSWAMLLTAGVLFLFSFFIHIWVFLEPLSHEEAAFLRFFIYAAMAFGSFASFCSMVNFKEKITHEHLFR